MPRQYEDIKSSELSSGKSKEEAERIAAATYNKHRKPGSPAMGPNWESRAKKAGLNPEVGAPSHKRIGIKRGK